MRHRNGKVPQWLKAVSMERFPSYKPKFDLTHWFFRDGRSLRETIATL